MRFFMRTEANSIPHHMPLVDVNLVKATPVVGTSALQGLKVSEDRTLCQCFLFNQSCISYRDVSVSLMYLVRVRRIHG